MKKNYKDTFTVQNRRVQIEKNFTMPMLWETTN